MRNRKYWFIQLSVFLPAILVLGLCSSCLDMDDGDDGSYAKSHQAINEEVPTEETPDIVMSVETTRPELQSDRYNCGAVDVKCENDEDCVLGICIANSMNEMASSEMSSAEQMRSSGTWYEKGPVLGGRLSGIVMKPYSYYKRLLVSSPGGSVWHGYDWFYGTSWVQLNNYGMGDDSVVHLEWDIMNSSRVYAATWNSLFASTNYGSSWTALVNSGASPGYLYPYQHGVVDPKPFAQLKFNSTQRAVFFSRGCYGLYYSFDGTNFSRATILTGDDNCIGTIAPDPVSKYVYISTMKKDSSASHVYRSDEPWGYDDECLDFELANTGLPTDNNVMAMTSVSYGSSQDDLIALLLDGANNKTYKTLNGQNWTLVSTYGNQWTPRPLVYVGTGDELFHGNKYPFHTLNLGSTWNDFQLFGSHVDHRGIYIDPSSELVYTVNDGAGPFGAQHNITKWDWSIGSAPSNGRALAHTGLKVWQVYFAGLVPPASQSSPRRVYLGSQDNHAVCSDNGGVSWTADGGSVPVCGGDCFAMQFAPSEPNRVYMFDNGTTFFRSDDVRTASSCGDVTWTEINPYISGGAPNERGLRGWTTWGRNVVAVHPTDKNKVYFAFAQVTA